MAEGMNDSREVGRMLWKTLLYSQTFFHASPWPMFQPLPEMNKQFLKTPFNLNSSVEFRLLSDFHKQI